MTRVELDDRGGLRRWRAADGTVIAEIDAGEVRLHLAGTFERELRVAGPVEEHLVLGPVQRICDEDRPLARVAETDWARPARIPAIDAPARLPAGAGSALLNLLALAAQVEGRSLRYAGPYPTAALWAALAESFRAAGDEATFTGGALERALRGDASEVPVDFAPAPFDRFQAAPRVVVHLRDGIERAYVGGQAWTRSGARRLVVDGEMVRVVLWIGGAPWAEVAALGLDGRLQAGPRPLPAVRSSVLGKGFPRELVAALADLLVEGEPPLLAGAMHEVLGELPVVWGDPGADVVRVMGGAIVVHAGLWERLGGDAGRLAVGLAEALVAPVKLAAQRRLEQVPVGVAVH